MNVVMSAVTGMLAISFGIEGARVAKNVPVVSRRVRWGQLRCACVEGCLALSAGSHKSQKVSIMVKAINFLKNGPMIRALELSLIVYN